MWLSCPFRITAPAIPLIVATEPIERSMPPPTTTKNCAAAAIPMKVVPFSVSISTGSDRNVADIERPIVSKTANSDQRSEEHTSELQSQSNLVCRLLLEK